MKFRGYDISLKLLVFILVFLCLMTFWTQSHLRLSSDILSSVPVSDPVISDAKKIFERYRLPDKVAVDLCLENAPQPDKDLLAGSAAYLEGEMKKSGLFEKVGMEEPGSAFTHIMNAVADNLPAGFSAADLNEYVSPVLDDAAVRLRLNDNIELLGGFEGIGQTDIISKDPLGLRFIVLERLRNFLEEKGSSVYKGHILSSDGSHVLVVAHTKNPGMDTQKARQIAGLFNRVSDEFSLRAAVDKTRPVKLNAIGSYRAALDNEKTAKRDVIFAAIVSTLGIALLLLTCFPRPYIGLLSLLPGLAGTTAAMFVLSIIRPDMSLLALGFGGAILSFTVDSGISFFLFLDRTSVTTGKETSHEIRSVELMAMFTTAGAFLALVFSGFRIMADVGMFSALGAIFTFIFVHTLQPRIFISMPPARRNALLPVEKIADTLSQKPGWTGFILATVFGIVMAIAAKPVFNADLNRMNAVGPVTLAAEETFKNIWGDVFSRVYFLSEAKSIDDLRRVSDRMSLFFSQQTEMKVLASSFTLSDLLPSANLSGRNLQDWKDFWKQDRVSSLKSTIMHASRDYGFNSDAFEPFISSIENPRIKEALITGDSYEFLGLFNNSGPGKKPILISSAMPGQEYNAQALFSEFHKKQLGSMLDYRLFTEKLSGFVHGIFMRTLVMAGSGLAVLLLFYYLDLTLTFMTLLPVAFSIICTFGTFTLIGHPIDIPGLMLAVVILGLGIVFSIYIVRMQQRYIDENHPSMKTIRASVFMAATAMLIGFSVLALARHPLLSSAGLSATLGILYTFAGTNLLLPPLLRHVFRRYPFPAKADVRPGSSEHREMVLLRFRHLEVYARMFARFKMKFDPMFPKLASFINGGGTVLDVGCGYGVQGVWLKMLMPGMKICALDPDRERIRIAKRVLGADDDAHVSTAEEFKAYPQTIGAALMLDMVHYIPDDGLEKILMDIRERLTDNGRLILRVTIPSGKKVPWERWLEIIRNMARGSKIWLRSKNDVSTLLRGAGFKILLCEATAPGREETWFVSEPAAGPGVL
jgi:uncharacterized protein